MALRGPDSATPEAIQKLAETNLKLLKENQSLRQAVEAADITIRVLLDRDFPEHDSSTCPNPSCAMGREWLAKRGKK